MSLVTKLRRIHPQLHPHLWVDRVIIWIGAIVTGLAVVLFVRMTDFANLWFAHMRDALPWLPLLLTPLGGAAVVWLTQKYFAGAAGSGIPQVIAAVNADLSAEGKSLLISLRLTVGKMVLGAAAMLAGFSTGREGPSAQVAAGVMNSFHRFVIHKPLLKQRDLILAGGAAGIAAAFNAPLAGVVFAIEELSKRFEERSSGVLITAIVIAGLVAISIMGNLSYFGRIPASHTGLDILTAAALVTLAAGVLGGAFARLLIHSFRDRNWRVNQWRGRYPVRFAAACGLVVATLGVFTGGNAFGSGYLVSRDLLNGHSDISTFYFAEKFVATWLSFWSGIPGGIFAPALAVGAGIGHDVALLTATANSAPIIALGMCGFLAAVTQAPITSFIIVMEMTEGHTMVLSLMASALLSSIISRLVTEPLYPALAALQVTRVEGVLEHSRR